VLPKLRVPLAVTLRVPIVTPSRNSTVDTNVRRVISVLNGGDVWLS
jgi:hypothetical protein